MQLPIQPLTELSAVTSQIVPPVSCHAAEQSMEPSSTTTLPCSDSSTMQLSIEPLADLSAATSHVMPHAQCSISAQQVTPLSETCVNSKPAVSFHELQPIPHRMRPSNKRSRCKPPSFLLTSDEHAAFLQSKTKVGTENKKRQARRLVDKIETAKTSRAPNRPTGRQCKKTPEGQAEHKVKRQKSRLPAGKNSKKASSAAADDVNANSLENGGLVSSEDNTPCIYCEIPYSESSVSWFKCCICDKWACGNCARMGHRPKGVFTCHSCK